VDLDPQCHATVAVGATEAVEGPGIAEVLGGWASPEATAIDVAPGLRLLPSSWRLADLETRLTLEEVPSTRLAEALRGASGGAETLVLDCPPGTGLLTRSALAAADLALLPVETSYFAVFGVGRMLALLEEEGRRRGAELPFRLLLTLFDRRTALSREVLVRLRREFGPLLLDTVIGLNVTLREAASHGRPITAFRRRSRGFRDHMELGREIQALFADAIGKPGSSAVAT
jgi:chromosome partitioning protein